MALDNFKNNAIVTVSIGYDNLATSVVLQAGDGAKLATPPFNAEWWNSTDYTNPSNDPNKEIVRVTAISTDTLTITRGAETSAFTHNIAGKVYMMIAGLTAKTLNTDVPATYTAYNATMTTAGGVAYVSGSGAITEDDANLHYDSTNKRVGIGLNNPSYPLHIKAAGIGNYQHMAIESTGKDVGFHWVKPAGGINWSLVATGTGASQGASKLIFYRDDFDGLGGSVVLDSSGHMGVGTISPAYMLHAYDGGGTGVVAIDSNLNPALVIANSGTPKAYIAVPTGANGDITDSVAGDLCIRSESHHILDSVDAGTSARRITVPTHNLTNSGTTTTTVMELTCANNTIAGVEIHYAVEAHDGSAKAAYENGVFQASLLNIANVLTQSSQTVNIFKNANPSLIMTVTWAITAANPGIVTVVVAFGATPAAGYPKFTYTVENFTRPAISPQW